MGRHEANRGESFEADLEAAHAAYRALGIADIIKLPVPTKGAPAPGRGGMGWNFRVAVSRQRYDYAGCFGPNAGHIGRLGCLHGRAIVMEAKSTKSTKPSLSIIAPDSSGSGVAAPQLQSLAEAYSGFGAFAVIVWRNGDRRLVLVPPAVEFAWLRYQAGGRRSIPVDEWVDYDVSDLDEGMCGIEDWLFAVRVWHGENGPPSPLESSLRRYDMVPYRVCIQCQKIEILDREGGAVVESVKVPQFALDRRVVDGFAEKANDQADLARMLRSIGDANETGAP